jgi:hypothetical protein
MGVLGLESVVWPKGKRYSGRDFDILAKGPLY